MSGPERIWADNYSGKSGEGYWRNEPLAFLNGGTPYIRADLHQSALRAARENALREALVALRGAGSFGRTAAEKHAALEQYCLCRDAILALIPKDGEKP